jgi:hypothetical protein
MAARSVTVLPGEAAQNRHLRVRLRSGQGNGMSQDMPTDSVKATATQFGIPGIGVGVQADGQEVHACHGVTGVDSPLPFGAAAPSARRPMSRVRHADHCRAASSMRCWASARTWPVLVTESNRPPSSEGCEKPAPRSRRERTDRGTGGQPGHPGRTLRQVRDPDERVVHPPWSRESASMWCCATPRTGWPASSPTSRC